MLSRPYFMEKREWYATPSDFGIDETFFEDGRGYHLTEKAPKEAIESYNEYYSESELFDENGNSFKRDGATIVF